MYEIEAINPSIRVQVEDHIYLKVDATIGRGEFYRRNPAQSHRTAAILSGAKGISSVALTRDVAVGYVLIDVSDRSGRKHAEITHLYVHPAHRRTHIATQLMAHARLQMARSGVETVSVFAGPKNTTAIAFYQSVGMHAATLELECDFASFCSSGFENAA